MASTILMRSIIMIVIPILIISVSNIQPIIQTFSLQETITNNQTMKNSINILDNATSNANNNPQFKRSENVGSKLEPSDIAPFVIGGNTNPQKIINLLSSMTSDDVSKFPLKDIPAEELLIVLNGLSAENLFKTLESIPADDLVDIFNKLPQDKGRAILSKLPPDQTDEISSRITSTLYE